MKAIFTVLCCTLATSLFSQSNVNQTLSVNGTGAAADASAQLDVSATDKGVLVPRMTTAQRTAITAANALLVFNSDTRSFWFFDTPAAAWREIRAGNIATLQDADGNTKVQVEKNPNEDIIRFDLAGTENMVLRKNGGGSPRLEFSGSNTFVGTNAGSANTGDGINNTAMGAGALAANTTGSNITALGYGADVTADNLTNATALGYDAKVGASSSLVLGGTGADAVNVGIGTQTPGHPLHLNVNGTGFAHSAGGILLTTFADTSYSPVGAWIGTASNHPLHFFADNPAAPQMTLTQNGDLGIGTSTIPAGIKLRVEGNIATPSGNSVYVGGVTNAGADGLRMHQTAGGSYIDHKGAGDLLFRADNTLGGTVRMTIQNNGNVGIGRTPVTNILEVEGDASKSSAGDWLANSDARLKKNIAPLNSQDMLQKLLALQGVTYEWNDDQTGSKRPEGIQYGFTAQNIQQVFPTLVEEDKLGFLQTAYGTYDAMMVEAIRALYNENEALKAKVETLNSQLDKISAALADAGITVEK